MATEKAFKVGDRVRLKASDGRLGEGHVGTITELSNTWNQEKCRAVDGAPCWLSNLELLSDSPEPSEGKAECAACGAPSCASKSGYKDYNFRRNYGGENERVFLCAHHWESGDTDDAIRARRSAKPSHHTGPTAAEVRKAHVLSVPDGPYINPGNLHFDPYADERTGPYGGNDLSHEAHIAALMVERDRKVKVLKSEMGREVTPPRFPHPGRNFALEKWR